MAYYKYSNAAASSSEERDVEETLTHRVYRTLHEEIISGAIRPGHRLVRKTMAKRLGVSPMPVTEALYMLEIDGLVESRPLYGCRVRPLTLEDVHNDQVLREAIECQVARLCAEGASEAALSKLLSTAKQLDRMMATGGPESKLGMQTHWGFHLEIARAAGFASLVEELQRVWFRVYMRLNWIKATHYRRVPADWHQQLVQVITSRDPDQAEAKMRAHIRYGQEDDRTALQFYLAQATTSEDTKEATP